MEWLIRYVCNGYKNIKLHYSCEEQTVLSQSFEFMADESLLKLTTGSTCKAHSPLLRSALIFDCMSWPSIGCMTLKSSSLSKFWPLNFLKEQLRPKAMTLRPAFVLPKELLQNGTCSHSTFISLSAWLNRAWSLSCSLDIEAALCFFSILTHNDTKWKRMVRQRAAGIVLQCIQLNCNRHKYTYKIANIYMHAYYTVEPLYRGHSE